MPAYVAFLRGINVGGHGVRNERLAEVFAQLGFDGALPVLSTGNVVFETDERGTAALETTIASALHEALGFPAPAFVRTGDEVAAVAGHDPFPDAPAGGKLHIGFLRGELDGATQDGIAALARETDRVAIHGRHLYWHVTGRFLDSALSEPPLAQLLGDAWTVRTANTVQRVATKLPA